ncbi:hypothetical protein TNCV_2266591 [Trichonephila clavipes]|nr:hypothetical protein TNCV_2266591 [Trichonephila clavipes]
MRPRRKAVVEFRLATGHDCLLKHLHRIHVVQAPFCTFRNIWEDLDVDHIRHCPALKGSYVRSLLTSSGLIGFIDFSRHVVISNFVCFVRFCSFSIVM